VCVCVVCVYVWVCVGVCVVCVCVCAYYCHRMATQLQFNKYIIVRRLGHEVLWHSPAKMHDAVFQETVNSNFICLSFLLASETRNIFRLCGWSRKLFVWSAAAYQKELWATNNKRFHQTQLVYYTGRFIMFSMITNIYNKETKGLTLIELFTATGKLKKFFLTPIDVRCVHHWWHGTHRYDILVLATHASTWVHRYSSLLQRSVPLGQRGQVAMVGRILSTKCTLHSNHRLTVWYSNTQNDFSPRSGHFLTTYTRIA